MILTPNRDSAPLTNWNECGIMRILRLSLKKRIRT